MWRVRGIICCVINVLLLLVVDSIKHMKCTMMF